MTLAYAITGSFCTHSKSLAVLEELIGKGCDIVPVFSAIVCDTSTRFGTSDGLEKAVVNLCGKPVIKTIAKAEEIITRGNFDCVVVSPCTGNTLAKIAHGITDTAVTMSVKAQLRNLRPVLLALATNDALGANFKNIGLCNDKKHVFLCADEAG
ncbi:MAG: dipicolinate synthase subunit B [Eubacteriales bacterium]|nr:dipicolinate synthase subunit B [Eubacteriales bacterium]